MHHVKTSIQALPLAHMQSFARDERIWTARCILHIMTVEWDLRREDRVWVSLCAAWTQRNRIYWTRLHDMHGMRCNCMTIIWMHFISLENIETDLLSLWKTAYKTALSLPFMTYTKGLYRSSKTSTDVSIDGQQAHIVPSFLSTCFIFFCLIHQSSCWRSHFVLFCSACKRVGR